MLTILIVVGKNYVNHIANVSLNLPIIRQGPTYIDGCGILMTILRVIGKTVWFEHFLVQLAYAIVMNYYDIVDSCRMFVVIFYSYFEVGSDMQ